jgi:hypothetical protein
LHQSSHALETITPLYIFLGILEDSGPIVPLMKYLVPILLSAKCPHMDHHGRFQDLIDIVFSHTSPDDEI